MVFYMCKEYGNELHHDIQIGLNVQPYHKYIIAQRHKIISFAKQRFKINLTLIGHIPTKLAKPQCEREKGKKRRITTIKRL
jgi:hypothetical protein